MSDVPAHLREATESIKAPDDASIARARALAQQYFDTSAECDRLDDELRQAKARRLDLQMKQLPELFSELGIDKIGLPESRVDVTVAPYYKASIPTSWPEPERQRAFEYLQSEEVGGGDLIRAVVSVEFRKAELESAQQLAEIIRTQFPGANEHPVELKMDVPWQSETAFVRERIESGEKFPEPKDVIPELVSDQPSISALEVLGATVGLSASIKKRKD